jgi:hypothetical protein
LFIKKITLIMKKLVLSTFAIVLFSSAVLAQQAPASAPTSGASKKKVELKAKKPASIPAASTTTAPSTPAPATPSAPSVKIETPQANVPKVEAPKVETPQANVPKMEAPKVEMPAMNPMGDLGALGKNIATELGTKLLLNQIQGTKVGQLISTFLMAKSSILPLLKSDPTGFASKLSGAQGDLMGGLKTVLSAQQMTNFMSMKPKTNDATNVLSSLFF